MAFSDHRYAQSVLAVPLGQEYAIPVMLPAECNFPLTWRAISEACAQAFRVFDVKPEKDLSEAYNNLNKHLCHAHALVYRLTAYPCSECPSLVRGSSYARVTGDRPESTQVLVIYYLLRELLKKQLQQCRQHESTPSNVIDNYLDFYEKLTAGVNMMKCVFTYIHWVWEKLGLPTEHLILPTETVAMHIWVDIVITDVKDRLCKRALEIVTAVRSGADMDYKVVESVKRLSLNLALLNDSRQTHYTTIVETPYVKSMSDFYTDMMPTFRRKGPENYIYLVLKAVAKEEFLARCFLTRQSLEKVREQMIATLIASETAYLRLATEKWLRGENRKRSPLYRASLYGLYELLGGGVRGTWLEELITLHVKDTAKKNIQESRDPGDADVSTQALRSIKITLQRFHSMLEEVFGSKPLLFNAMLQGFKLALNELCEDPDAPTVDAGSIAKSLAKLASEEISANGAVDEAGRNWIPDIYGLLDKKGVFHATYEKMLETTLLTSTWHALTNEECADRFEKQEDMIRQFFIHGKNFDFVALCHRMVKDAYVTSRKFATIASPGLPLKPLVLTKFAWGGLTPASSEDAVAGPEAVASAVAWFKEEYVAGPSGYGKVLEFLPHYSTATVRMRMNFGTSQVNKLMVVSCYQLSLLLLFNKKRTWLLSEIESELRASAKTLSECIRPLLLSGVLRTNEGKTQLLMNTAFEDIQEGCLVLVPTFHTGVGGAEAVAEKSQGGSASDQARVFACEAAIVTLLKQKGDLSMDEIQLQVQERLRRFDVPKRDVKRAIEKLIEREYVGRDPETNSFHFMA